MMPAAGPGSPKDTAEAECERLAGLLAPLASPVRLKLLRFLTRPHYLEEIASHLVLTRQAARKHLDQLVRIGVVDKRPGTRDTGTVVEYRVAPRAIFLVYEEFEKLGSLDPEGPDPFVRTMAEPSRRADPRLVPGPCFHVVRGFNTGRVLRIARGPKEWVIGRDELADFCIDHDPYASNRHAEVRWEPPGFVLADLHSTNGTTHNWVRLARGAEANLRHGDLVGVGRTLLLFWDAG